MPSEKTTEFQEALEKLRAKQLADIQARLSGRSAPEPPAEPGAPLSGEQATKLISVKDAARILGLDTGTIHRRIRAGRLPAWGTPGCTRIRVIDLMPPYAFRSNPRSSPRTPAKAKAKPSSRVDSLPEHRPDPASASPSGSENITIPLDGASPNSKENESLPSVTGETK